MTTKSAELVYQIKITLQDSKPPIWRRLLVMESVSLYKLHQIFQVAMGWTDSHLHQFIVGEKYYGIPSSEDWRPVLDERRYRLNQIAPAENSKFIYEYDFGDSWGHVILVEKIQPSESGMKYPICVKGKQACPPEDVGGVWGYLEFLEAMSSSAHKEHDKYVAWVGEKFDPAKFDINKVNQALRKIR
jgi:hypothetical protein